MSAVSGRGVGVRYSVAWMPSSVSGKEDMHVKFSEPVWCPERSCFVSELSLGLWRYAAAKGDEEAWHNESVLSEGYSRIRHMAWVTETSIPEAMSSKDRIDLLTIISGQVSLRPAEATSMFKHLVVFCNGELYEEDMTKSFFVNFYEHLLRLLKGGSANLYMTQLLALIKDMEREGVLSRKVSALFPKLRSFPVRERVWLTEEEVRLLEDNVRFQLPRSKRGTSGAARIRISRVPMRRMLLFAMYSGLRYSDLCALTPRHIHKVHGVYHLRMHQKKGSVLLSIPISKQAYAFLPTQSDPHAPYFRRYDPCFLAKEFRSWVRGVGIDKDVVIHSTRHTYAMRILGKTKDVHLTSKMLGHQSIRATTKYLRSSDGDMVSAMPR